MRIQASNSLAGLRRRKALPGLAIVWMFVLQTLLGGLALARILPTQYAATLTGSSLCLPGEDGSAPAAGHEHEACQICPHMGAGPALPPPAGLPFARMPAPVVASDRIPARASGESAKPDVRASGPRAPPHRG